MQLPAELADVRDARRVDAGTGETEFAHGTKREGLVREIAIDKWLEQRPTAGAHHAQHSRRGCHILDHASAALGSTSHVPEIADALGGARNQAKPILGEPQHS